MPTGEPFDGIDARAAGAYLRAKRDKAGLTQAQLADRIGIPNENYIGNFENGKNDWRRSKYRVPIIQELGISLDEARAELGLTLIVDDAALNRHAPARPEGSRSAPGGVLIRHFGIVQAGAMPFDADALTTTPTLVECPLPEARGYKSEDLFVLDVTGDSMTCGDVQKRIPAGASVLFHANLEPRKGDIVAAWIPEIGPNGMGVLKVFNRDKDEEVVLESYNPRGPRLPAAKYPNMRVQGVALSAWFPLRKR